MFTLHLTGLVCSSPLPASGRRSQDKRGREEVRTGRHKMTDGRRASQRLGAYNAASRIVLLHARPQDSRQWQREPADFPGFLLLFIFTRSAVTCNSRLRPLNVGLLLFVEREMSAA